MSQPDHTPVGCFWRDPLPRGTRCRGDGSQVLSVISAVADRVDEGGLAFFHLLDGALERGVEIVAVFERAFGIPTHGFREAGEVRIRAEEVHADVRAIGVGAAGSR